MAPETEKKTQVEEQRVKPTLIRRRAKKAPEVLADAAASGSGALEGSQTASLAETSAPQKIQDAIKAAESAKSKAEAATARAPASEAAKQKAAEGGAVSIDGVRLSKPSEAERKIGVVGFINLGTVQPVKVVEDWREKQKRGPKKKKSRAELELEAIQRAGGLKQYAKTVEEEVLAPVSGDEISAPVAEERIFQPGPSSRRRKVQRKEFKKTEITAPRAIKKVIRMEEGITVSGLSQSLGVKAGELIKKLMNLGLTVTVNQSIDVDTATLIAGEYGFTVEHTAFKEEDILVEPEASVSIDNLAPRAPVVTVMGHVDHGKTSILDVIRKANVAEGEAGGITQHIGAYEVKLPKGKITFLDTPGHEAFTMMRARGAEATDIVVLVVAADDGIMPQTIEAIDHAKAAGVPVIIAVNKIDKPEAQPERVKQSLTEYGLVPEEWGGETICVPTSAKKKTGIDKLLDMVLLQSEMLELKADPTIRPKGIVLEARLDKGRGPVASVLVQEGTLKVGQYVVCGMFDGKVRAMLDWEGKPVKEAGPSKPVEIQGLSGVPSASDEMVGVDNDRSAKLVAEQRAARLRERQLTKTVHVSLEDLAKQLADGEVKELNVVLKTDVHGSLEAITDALAKISTEQVKLKVLHTGVGGITESDVLLASASDAIVFGFNVYPDGKAKDAADREGVEIRSYKIIYEMLDEVRKAMEGLLAPEEKEVWLGRAEVREVFKITKVGAIAGCHVVQGKIQRNAQVRLLRDQVMVFDGKLASLKRFKDDVKEVTEGYECGMGIENFNDLKVGDVIEAYIIEKKAAVLL